MRGLGRYGRPGGGSLLAMMIVNGVVSLLVLSLLFALFDVRDLPPLPTTQAAGWAAALKSWDLLWWMLPGAGIGLGCLWFWLILVGRSKGVPWGGALVYAMIVALVNAPLSGFLLGLLHGNPLLGLLIGLAVLLIQHALLLALITFGIIMGSLNAWLATTWIAAHRPRS